MTKCHLCDAEVLSTSQPDPDIEARITVLSDALKSISKNTCCDNCREAALVARSALASYVGLARETSQPNRMGTTPGRVLRKWQKELDELNDMDARDDLTAIGQHSLRKVRQFVDDLTATPSRSLMGTTPEMQKMYDEFGGETVTVTDEMVETAWAAIVGNDIAKTCFNASIIRADLKTGLTAALAATPAVGGEVAAWQWRACIGGKWGSWLILERPVEKFRQSQNFNLDNGTYELRPLYAAQPASPLRVTGAINLVEEAACLIWCELCPGSVMGDDDLPHYEAAAKAVLALPASPLRGREISEDLALADYRDKAYERLHALCGTRNDAPNWADIACILRERDELYEKLRASPPEQPAAVPAEVK